jgi:hypothetical protein
VPQVIQETHDENINRRSAITFKDRHAIVTPAENNAPVTNVAPTMQGNGQGQAKRRFI